MARETVKVVLPEVLEKDIKPSPIEYPSNSPDNLNGFIRKVTTRDGSVYETAYYKISGLRYSGNPRKVTFCFNVWKDQASQSKGLLRGVQGKSLFEAHGADYDKWFSPEAVRASGNDPLAQAYLFAKEQLKDDSIIDVVK